MTANRHKIIRLPNKHLRQRSQKVGLVTNEIRAFCEDMVAAAIDWENSRDHEVTVGLAAVQMDKLIRAVIIRKDFENFHDKRFEIFINPEITKYEGEQYTDHEGCLSIPKIYGMVPRFSKVRVKALDINGKPFRVKAEGFLARLLQHEVDHLNGKLFIDHIKDTEDAFYQLSDDGRELIPIDYDTVKNDKDLWG